MKDVNNKSRIIVSGHATGTLRPMDKIDRQT